MFFINQKEKKQFNFMNLSVRCEKLTTRNPVGNTPMKDKKRKDNDCLIFHPFLISHCLMSHCVYKIINIAVRSSVLGMD